MARPAPGQALPNDCCMPCAVPTRIYEAVPMLPPISTGWPTARRASGMEGCPGPSARVAAEIFWAGVGLDWRSCQFAVRQLDAELAGGDGHAFQILGADLVAEAARAAVNADPDVVQLQAESLGGLGV